MGSKLIVLLRLHRESLFYIHFVSLDYCNCVFYSEFLTRLDNSAVNYRLKL
jgi:hypothetical protein